MPDSTNKNTPHSNDSNGFYDPANTHAGLDAETGAAGPLEAQGGVAKPSIDAEDAPEPQALENGVPADQDPADTLSESHPTSDPQETEPTWQVTRRPLPPLGTAKGVMDQGEKQGCQPGTVNPPVGGVHANPSPTPSANPPSSLFLPGRATILRAPSEVEPDYYAGPDDLFTLPLLITPQTLDAPTLAALVKNPYDFLDLPQPTWHVPGLVTAGSLALLYGAPKCGKSTLLAALLRAMSVGGEFLGHQIEPVPTLLLSEMRPEAIRAQMVTAGDTTRTSRRGVLLAQDCRGVKPEDLPDLLMNVVAETQDPPRLLVIDTMAAFFPMGEGQSGNDYSSAGRQAEHLQRLAEGMAQFGGGVLSTHHARKAEGAGSLAVLGSSALAAAFDVLCHLRVDNKGRRSLTVISRYGDNLLPSQGNLTCVDGVAHVDAEETTAPKAPDHEREQIEELLLLGVGKGKHTRQELKEMYPHLPVSDRRYNQLLKGLADSGHLVAEPLLGRRTKYSLPPPEANPSWRC